MVHLCRRPIHPCKPARSSQRKRAQFLGNFIIVNSDRNQNTDDQQDDRSFNDPRFHLRRDLAAPPGDSPRDPLLDELHMSKPLVVGEGEDGARFFSVSWSTVETRR